MNVRLFLLLWSWAFSLPCVSFGQTPVGNGRLTSKKEVAIATFAGGNFWCMDALFRQVRGVDSLVVGYTGEDPHTPPTYKLVSSGKTSYIEVVRIFYNPKFVSYSNLVEIFFGVHDPTSIHRQGSDIGYRYKSVIFYHNEAQKAEALEQKRILQLQFPRPIVTEILPIRNFYPAEEEHQQFYVKHPMYPYSRLIIKPKVDKMMQDFFPFIYWK